VFKAVGYTKFPYGLCWYLDIIGEDQDFVEYNHNDFTIKVIGLNIVNLETTDLFNLRISNEITVQELRNLIGQVIFFNL
jgi:hypothetical protein